MPRTFPGTTIEVTCLKKDASRLLFDGIFATGGITLSQVCIMTDLEPYMVQNWIKRGFVSSPKKRVYSREQLARILIINMLRESLQIEKICGLIQVIDGNPSTPDDDFIGSCELYHKYVDLLATEDLNLFDRTSVLRATEAAAEDFPEREAGARKKLSQILSTMLYAHSAAGLKTLAEESLSLLQ